MKVALNTEFMDLENNIIPRHSPPQKFENGKIIPLTMYDVLRIAATSELPEDVAQGSTRAIETKMKAFEINLKVLNAGLEVDLSEKEREFLRGRIAMCFTVLVCGPAIRALTEPESIK